MATHALNKINRYARLLADGELERELTLYYPYSPEWQAYSEAYSERMAYRVAIDHAAGTGTDWAPVHISRLPWQAHQTDIPTGEL